MPSGTNLTIIKQKPAYVPYASLVAEDPTDWCEIQPEDCIAIHKRARSMNRSMKICFGIDNCLYIYIYLQLMHTKKTYIYIYIWRFTF